MSAAALARLLEVPTNRITEILNGRRAVTGDTALRLAHFFGTSAEFWLNLQKLYELRFAEQKLRKGIRALPTLKDRHAMDDAGRPADLEVVEPPTLFRAVKDQQAAYNHLDGVLWLRAHAYFRDIEGPAADPSEGIGTSKLPDGQVNHDITDDVPVYPAFMLCFSAEKSAAKKFGDSCLKVGNPIKLKKRVEAALPEGGVVSVSWRKVEYRKTLKVEADPGADGLARKYWWKPEKYSNEKEWRLLVEFRGNLRLLNKTLKLHIGRPSGNLFRLVSSD